MNRLKEVGQLAPLKALVADPTGRSGLEARRVWAFVDAARPRLSGSAYRFLEAMVTEQPSIGFIDRQCHIHSDDWNAVARVCKDVLSVLNQWSEGSINAPVLLPPPADLELASLSLEDVAGALALYQDIAYEEAERVHVSTATPAVMQTRSQSVANIHAVGKEADLRGGFYNVLKKDAPRAWIHQDAANRVVMEIKAAARSSAREVGPHPALTESLNVSWTQGGVRVELREQDTSTVIASDNPGLVKAAKRMLWFGKMFELASDSEVDESKCVLELDVRKAFLLLQRAENPLTPELEAIPCLLA